MRYFFVHLQKTAGTALFQRLRHQFDADAVYPMPQYQGTAEAVLDVDLMIERVARHGDEVRVVTGHFPLCTVDRLPGTFATFTVLRDPVERALSFLRHQREQEPRFRDASLEEIYDDPICREALIRNHMVRMLSLSAAEMTDGALTLVTVDDARLAAAQRALHERIDVVGVQERFDAFCAALESRFGWDLGPPRFANRTAAVDVDDALRARIAADNEYDIRLYDVARDLVMTGEGLQ